MTLLELCHGTSIFPQADQTVGMCIPFLELSLSSYVLRIDKRMTTILDLDIMCLFEHSTNCALEDTSHSLCNAI